VAPAPGDGTSGVSRRKKKSIKGVSESAAFEDGSGRDTVVFEELR
jgi:hypothetical protein